MRIFWFNFIFGVMPFLNLERPKLNILLNRNSFYRNFLWNFAVDKGILSTFTGISDLISFLREHITLALIYYFVKLVRNRFGMNDRGCTIRYVLTDNVQMFNKYDNYESIICICLLPTPVFDYNFLSDCPSLMHFIAIPYVQHCKAMFWSVRYVSLITLSLMYHILGKSVELRKGNTVNFVWSMTTKKNIPLNVRLVANLDILSWFYGQIIIAKN